MAVATVLVHHLVATLEYQSRYANSWLSIFTAHIGRWGVLAFFVHTSLVLMYSLDRLDRSGNDRVAIRFYIRRVFRIYPLSISCIAVVVLLGIPSVTWEPAAPVSWRVIASNVLLVQNIWTKQSVVGPLWSLPYEVQMYVVLPLLHRYARRDRSAVGLLALIGLFSAVGTLLAFATGSLNMAAYIPCFLSGVLCYAFGRSQRSALPAVLWPFYLIALVASYSVIYLWSPKSVFWVDWIFCLVLGLTINLFRETRFPGFNAMTHRIATYSYGLYLWHVPVIYLLFNVLDIRNPLLGTLVYFSLSYLASFATYHAIEAPMIKVGRQLSMVVP